MNRVFVISDTWFNRILDDEQSINVLENNSNIINNWNNAVDMNDIVYVLGGFGIADLYQIVARLNGEIHFLDNYFNEEERGFISELKSYIEKSTDEILRDRIIFENKQIIVLNELDSILSYFPLVNWIGQETGTYCFHGLNDYADITNHNISCVVEGHKPINIQEIQNSIKSFTEKL